MALNTEFNASLADTIEQLKRDRVYKRLNYLDSPQAPRVQMEGRGEVLILSSNNYLGLSDEPSVIDAGIDALRRYGAGTASVRFICGTFTIHRQLEETLARFVGAEASLSFVSAWNANEGLTATIAQEGDFIVSDALIPASISDSRRLAKSISNCTTAVSKLGDMDDLRAKLAEGKNAKRRMIWTDGIFSMEGAIAKLPDILQIARDTNSIVAVDDSHATGVLADYLTQRSRPQLFSNALPPTVAASAVAAVHFVERHPECVERLRQNTKYFREQIVEAGFKPIPGDTPIVPIIVGETAAAIQMSDLLLDQGVFVTGFGYPVVPQGQARVRCQISAAHTREDLDQAVRAFKLVGAKLGIVR
jgi:glycine C-acetyltransferase